MAGPTTRKGGSSPSNTRPLISSGPTFPIRAKGSSAFPSGWNTNLLAYLKKLDAIKPVIYTGDLNVAHERIDIKNPDANVHNAGFTPEERAKMDALLSSGFADTFRRLHPEEVKYSWWSYRFHARENNAGWRIDYFLVSERILSKVNASEIHNEIYGSDHCPVLLDIEL